MTLDLLDEKGFMFIDASDRVYWVRMWGESPWLFIWLPAQDNFMSVRKVSQMDIWQFPRNMSAEQEQHYRDLWENNDMHQAMQAFTPPEK